MFANMAASSTAPVAVQVAKETKPPSERLLSLDVYRGLAVAGMILVDNPGSDDLAYGPIKHAQWNGWTAADLIFPSFLFLVGVSMVFSFTSRMKRGESRSRILRHVLIRSMLLIAIGLVVNVSPIIGLDLHTWRIYGVTQRIALCYVAAAILVLWSDYRGQLIALVCCLVGYWTILHYVRVPGYGVPGRDVPFMDPDRNLVAWLDRKLLAGRLYNGTRDPEGLISTLGAIGTILMGVLTGNWLRSEKSQVTKALRMLLVGLAAMALGLIWNRWFPINKNLWTSSFALFTGGFALILLSGLFWLLEIKRRRGAWMTPLLVFGMNAIVAFLADSVVYGPGYTFTAHGPDGAKLNWHEAAQAWLVSFGPSAPVASLIYSLAAVTFCWMLLWLLWRKRIFIKL